MPVFRESLGWRPRALCMLVLFWAVSQPAYPAAEKAAQTRALLQGWSVGALLLVIDQPYQGKSTRVLALPSIGFEGNRVFLRGLRFGVHLKSSPKFTLDFLLQPRFAAFKASEFRNIPGLEDRRDSMDAGLDMHIDLPGASAIGITVLADALGRSNGQEWRLRYEYVFNFGRTRITPWVGVRWISTRLADYYYGTLASEVSAGAPDYRPGAAILPQTGISIFTPLWHSHWTLFTLLSTNFFPARLTNSPLVDGSTDSTFILGLSYHF